MPAIVPVTKRKRDDMAEPRSSSALGILDDAVAALVMWVRCRLRESETAHSDGNHTSARDTDGALRGSALISYDPVHYGLLASSEVHSRGSLDKFVTRCIRGTSPSSDCWDSLGIDESIANSMVLSVVVTSVVYLERVASAGWPIVPQSLFATVAACFVLATKFCYDRVPSHRVIANVLFGMTAQDFAALERYVCNDVLRWNLFVKREEYENTRDLLFLGRVRRRGECDEAGDLVVDSPPIAADLSSVAVLKQKELRGSLPGVVGRLAELISSYNPSTVTVDELLARAEYDSKGRLCAWDLRSMRISRLPPHGARYLSVGWPDHFRFCRGLDLSWNRLATLPDDFFEAEATRIDLSHNRLESLPDSIARVSVQSALDLSYNCLGSLPESISRGTHGVRLYLNHNALHKLPTSFGDIVLSSDTHGQITLQGNPQLKVNLSRVRRLRCTLVVSQDLYYGLCAELAEEAQGTGPRNDVLVRLSHTL